MFNFWGKLAVLLAASAAPMLAQGCIVARSSGQNIGLDSAGGYLSPGEWNLALGYRHLYSFRHFVGPTEQKYRIQQGTQVMNKINLETINLTYQITPRYSVSVDVPFLLASRRSNNSPYTTSAQGLGDTIVAARGWLWNPTENTRGNVAFSFGYMAPTGKDNVKNRVDAFDGKGPRDVVLDYSVQPGTGGYGLVFQWESFKNLGHSPAQLYFNGSYIATPQNTNNVLRTTSSTNPLTARNSISDEYLLEAGVAYGIQKVRGLTLTFGPRDEGVPASDLIGKSGGFRRPGFAISLEPGFQYVHGKSLLSASVGRAIYRDRTRSTADKISGGHGDAAFADYVWLANYSFRFGGRGHAPADPKPETAKACH